MDFAMLQRPTVLCAISIV